MAKKYLDENGLLYFWGKLKAYFATITHTHTKSEITDFPTTMTPSSHTHGNIQNGGTLQTTDVTIANGDKLVVTDSSNSSKIARTSVTFDGSTETKVLAKKGDWVDLPTGVSPSSTTPKMDGTATVGTETAFARGDHIHPSDTSKVDKVSGKGLSTNDYTTTDKGKVDKLVFNGNEIDSSILPSYVDDVIEAYPRSGQTELSSTWLSLTSGGSALTPETGKIYVLMADSTSYSANSQFRWSGSAYVKLADGGVSEITNAEIDTIVAS